MAYATIDDFERVGLPPGALQSVNDATVTRALEISSAVADSYLRNQYKLPLAEPYDPALTDAVIRIASWRLMSRRGFNPSNPGDASLRMDYEDAVNYLKRIANGQATLALAETAPAHDEPMISSGTMRGYSGTGANSDSIGPYDGGL